MCVSRTSNRCSAARSEGSSAGCSAAADISFWLVKGLGDQILGQLPVAHAYQHDPQAVIAGSRIELREGPPVLLHT
jgi:hypothetical protein